MDGNPEFCKHCMQDLVHHHYRNLKCPNRETVFQRLELTSAELVQNFDARVWAAEFCRRNPGSDYELMLTWFSNALMAGWDEHRFRSAEYKRSVRRILVPWWKRWFVPLSNFGR